MDMTKDDIIDIVSEYLKGQAFTDRKLTDTPTDALQVVPKKYCDANSASVNGRMYLVGVQVVAVSSPNFEKVLLDTSSFSQNVTVDGTNHRLIATVAGTYQVNGAVQYQASDVASGCAIRLCVNGSTITENWVAAAQANGNTTAFASDILTLAVGDYVEIFTTKIFSNGTLSSSSAATYLSICKV